MPPCGSIPLFYSKKANSGIELADLTLHFCKKVKFLNAVDKIFK